VEVVRIFVAGAYSSVCFIFTHGVLDAGTVWRGSKA